MLDIAAKVINVSKTELPLLITDAEWDNNNLGIWGANWSFNTMSAFRLVFDDQQACGCYDSNMAEEIKKVIGNQIIAIEKLTQTGQDLTFILSNNSLIQVFATISIEPWVFSIDGKITFVGDGIIP